MASNAVSLSGVVTILNNSESNSIYFSANVLPFELQSWHEATYFELDTHIYL